MNRAGLLLAGGLLAAPIIAAQLKVDVQLVNVVATVTDEKGRYVADLTAADLIVEEDGQVQKISHFSQSNDLPVSTGLVLDTSGSMERKIETATKAIERFIRSIHKDDDIFLLTFANRPQVRQDFTDDRDKLASALRRITVGGGTALYDALYDGLRKIRHGEHDKKAILLVTDGEDTSSEIGFDEAQLAVRESELLIYCLGISPGPGGPMTERVPKTTGPTRSPSPGGGPTRRPTISLPFPIPIPGTGGPRYPGEDPRDPRYPDPRYPRDPRNPDPRDPRYPDPRYPDPRYPDPNDPRYPDPRYPDPRYPDPTDPTGQPQPRRSPGGGGTTGGTINPDTADMRVLNAFADASGGKAWLLSGNWTDRRASEVESALDEIAAELRNQYSIGYYPSHPLADGKWHRIQIRTKNSNYHVRARKEYFGR